MCDVIEPLTVKNRWGIAAKRSAWMLEAVVEKTTVPLEIRDYLQTCLNPILQGLHFGATGNEFEEALGRFTLDEVDYVMKRALKVNEAYGAKLPQMDSKERFAEHLQRYRTLVRLVEEGTVPNIDGLRECANFLQSFDYALINL